MKNDNKTKTNLIENIAEQTKTNPFNFQAPSQPSKTTRQIDYTPELISLSNRRASNLILVASKRSDLFNLVNTVLDNGQADDCIRLINMVYEQNDIVEDAQFLKGADQTTLARLLASRQSDRSKAKKAGLRSSMDHCRTFISSMYSEMLIRSASGKKYNAASLINVNTDDLDAVTRKIASLRSKKSRLNKLAQYDQEARAELNSVTAEIERLQAHVPGTVQSVKTVIKSSDIDSIRELLKVINPESLSEDERAKFEQLQSKIG